MPRQLPPFSAVKAFEAAARHGSFARAATELGVTSTAVSQHVKGLEQWLGEDLFIRRSNGVKITEKGHALLPELTKLLDNLAGLMQQKAEVEEPAKEPQMQLAISAMPAFAENWLAPRLKEFSAHHPEIALNIKAEEQIVPLDKRPEVDFAIRYGTPDHRGAASEILVEDHLVPVATAYYRDLLELNNPDNWKRATLLHAGEWSEDWLIWAQTHPALGLDPKSGSHFPRYSKALIAAKESKGILIGHRALIEEELQSGTLIALSDTSLPARNHFHLMRHRGHSQPAAIQFRAWLLATARA